MMIRVLGSVVILLAILLLPYWVYAPMILLAAIYFPIFWEGIILAMLVDVLYGSSGTGALTYFTSPFAIGAFSVLLAAMLVRDRLRINV